MQKILTCKRKSLFCQKLLVFVSVCILISLFFYNFLIFHPKYLSFYQHLSLLYFLKYFHMFQFFHDLFTYPFQKDKHNNKVYKLFTSVFKDFPALFWIKPTFKKIFIVPLLIIYHIFNKGDKNPK